MKTREQVLLEYGGFLAHTHSLSPALRVLLFTKLQEILPDWSADVYANRLSSILEDENPDDLLESAEDRR